MMKDDEKERFRKAMQDFIAMKENGEIVTISVECVKCKAEWATVLNGPPGLHANYICPNCAHDNTEEVPT